MLNDEEVMKWAKDDAFAKKHLRNIPLLRQLYANNNKATTVLELDPLINGQKCELALMPVEVMNFPDQLWSRKGGKANEQTAEEDKYLAHGTRWKCIDVRYDGTDQKEAEVEVQRAPWEMESLDDFELYKPYLIIGEYQVTPGKDGRTYTAVHPLEVRPYEDDKDDVDNNESEDKDEDKTEESEKDEPTKSTALEKDTINQQLSILVNHAVKQHNKLPKKEFDLLCETFAEEEVIEATKAYALRKDKNGDYVK